MRRQAVESKAEYVTGRPTPPGVLWLAFSGTSEAEARAAFKRKYGYEADTVKAGARWMILVGPVKEAPLPVQEQGGLLCGEIGLAVGK
jgi:hypothetical protein